MTDVDYDQHSPDQQAQVRAEWKEQMTARRLALRFVDCPHCGHTIEIGHTSSPAKT